MIKSTFEKVDALPADINDVHEGESFLRLGCASCIHAVCFRTEADTGEVVEVLREEPEVPYSLVEADRRTTYSPGKCRHGNECLNCTAIADKTHQVTQIS